MSSNFFVDSDSLSDLYNIIPITIRASDINIYLFLTTLSTTSSNNTPAIAAGIVAVTINHNSLPSFSFMPVVNPF